MGSSEDDSQKKMELRVWVDGDWWTLQGIKIGRKPTQPGVYIHKGQTVTIKRKR